MRWNSTLLGLAVLGLALAGISATLSLLSVTEQQQLSWLFAGVGALLLIDGICNKRHTPRGTVALLIFSVICFFIALFFGLSG